MMNYLLLLCGVVTFISASNTTDGGMAGGYILMERQGVDGKPIGLAAMAKLADAAATLPINRIWVAFFSPTMVYKAGSNTLKNTGLHISNETDGGYAKLKAAITKLQLGVGEQRPDVLTPEDPERVGQEGEGADEEVETGQH